MRIVLMILILAAVFIGPQLWVKRVFTQYRHNRDDFPGTGSELAQAPPRSLSSSKRKGRND